MSSHRPAGSGFTATIILAGASVALLFVLPACSSGGTDEAMKKKWLVLPGARFVTETVELDYPACPTADHPLDCPGDNGCCPEGYPFACPATDKCHSQPPVQECPDHVTCVPVDLQITSISPGAATVRYGQHLQARVEFRGSAAPGVTELVARLPYAGLGGSFEQPIPAEQAEAGLVQVDLRIEDEQPALTECLQDCSRSGTCEPCFAEFILPPARVDFGLRDAGGTVWGTVLVHLALTLDTSTDPGDDCVSDADCADFCDPSSLWREGAPGAESRGGFCVAGACYCCFAHCLIDPDTGATSDCRCMGCNEGGTDCDWDTNLSCHQPEDVCLFYL